LQSKEHAKNMAFTVFYGVAKKHQHK